MEALRNLWLKTDCGSCVNKCCSQPYDWVYLTSREINLLSRVSNLPTTEFVSHRRNTNTGHVFRTLNLPCRFLDHSTGQCQVYESRPLICKLFPFYPEPLTGEATLLPAQCGPNLDFLASESKEGWSLAEFENETRQWLSELWIEALLNE